MSSCGAGCASITCPTHKEVHKQLKAAHPEVVVAATLDRSDEDRRKHADVMQKRRSARTESEREDELAQRRKQRSARTESEREDELAQRRKQAAARTESEIEQESARRWAKKSLRSPEKIEMDKKINAERMAKKRSKDKISAPATVERPLLDLKPHTTTTLTKCYDHQAREDRRCKELTLHVFTSESGGSKILRMGFELHCTLESLNECRSRRKLYEYLERMFIGEVYGRMVLDKKFNHHEPNVVSSHDLRYGMLEDGPKAYIIRPVVLSPSAISVKV
jgi:hypothetical protein